jgi:hypothetical protein
MGRSGDRNQEMEVSLDGSGGKMPVQKETFA